MEINLKFWNKIPGIESLNEVYIYKLIIFPAVTSCFVYPVELNSTGNSFAFIFVSHLVQYPRVKCDVLSLTKSLGINELNERRKVNVHATINYFVLEAKLTFIDTISFCL